MTPEQDLEQQRIALTQAVGECILTWANIELVLSQLFSLTVHSDNGAIADAIWGSIKSFDGKGSMLHNVLQIRFKDSPAIDDWNLLYNHIQRMNGQRNKIVHSTMLSVEFKTMMLEPFFIMTQLRPHLSIDDVKHRINDFNILRVALFWFFHQVVMSPPQTTISVPIPDLILQLRSEELQRRKAQQERQKP